MKKNLIIIAAVILVALIMQVGYNWWISPTVA